MIDTAGQAQAQPEEGQKGWATRIGDSAVSLPEFLLQCADDKPIDDILYNDWGNRGGGDWHYTSSLADELSVKIQRMIGRVLHPNNKSPHSLAGVNPILVREGLKRELMQTIEENMETDRAKTNAMKDHDRPDEMPAGYLANLADKLVNRFETLLGQAQSLATTPNRPF